MSTLYVYEEWHPHLDVGIYLAQESSRATEEVEEYEVPVRHMAKWSNSELDALWNEFQIKRLMIQDIAAQHQRTCASILYKLKSEGLLDWPQPLNSNTIDEIIDKANELIMNADYDDEEEEEEEEDDEYVPVLSEEEEEEEDEEDEEEEEQEGRSKRVVFENYQPDMMDYVLYAYVDGLYYAAKGMRWTLNRCIKFLKFAVGTTQL